MSAHCLPIKSQNCQERCLHVEHFTPSIPVAKYRLRKHGCAQEGKFRYFGLKSRGYFPIAFSPLLPSFFFILVQFFGRGYLLGHISVGNVLGNSRVTGLEGRKCRWLVEDFHDHFRLNVSFFFVFLSWHGVKDRFFTLTKVR